MENEYSLYHFGVKGMRWGRRKGRTNSEADRAKRRATGKKVATGALKTVGVLGLAAAAAQHQALLQQDLCKQF